MLLFLYLDDSFMNTRNLKLYIIAALVIWMGLSLCRHFIPQSEFLIYRIFEVTDLCFETFAAIIAMKIYQNVSFEDKKLIKWLLFETIALFCTDVVWYIGDFRSSIFNMNLSRFIFATLNSIGFIFWGVSNGIFVLKILHKYVLSIKKRIKTILVLILIDVIITALYVYSVVKHLPMFPHVNHLQIGILFTLEIIIELPIRLLIIDVVIICLIYSESIGLILYSVGSILLTSNYSFGMYALISNKADLKFLVYADILWSVSLLFYLCGIFLLFKEKNINVSSWIRRDTSLRGKIVFSSFLIYTLVFSFTFILFYLFLNISILQVFCIVVSYAVSLPIIIYIFIYISKYLETPFVQIQNNINLMLSDSTEKQTDDFFIDEFIFLQDFINKSFAYKNEIADLKSRLEQEKFKIAEKEQEKFRKTIGQLVHDMYSPLEAINSFSNFEINDINDMDRVNAKAAVKRLSALTYNLLNKYKNKDFDIATKETMLVALSVIQIINEKELEYKNAELHINLDLADDCYFTPILINPDMFKGMISNLINNAIDATKNNSDRKITVKIRNSLEYITIFIEDNGYGMPKDIQEKFLQGTSATQGKATGNGIGLIQVYDTIKIGHGDFKIYVTEGVGTEIVIRFPISKMPIWLASEINLYPDDIIIILDDDGLVHNIWNQLLKSIVDGNPEIILKNFYNGHDVLDYTTHLSPEEKARVILLTDYEILKSDITGVDVIKTLGIKRSILITSYGDEVHIQNQIIASMIKMLPKTLIRRIPIIMGTRIEPHSKAVDMVWLDDQDFYVRARIKEVYANLIIDVYNDPMTFMTKIVNYKYDTKIILDMYYEMPNGQLYAKSGLELANELHASGYSNLTLLTGETPDYYVPEYITVILKNDENNVPTLNQL